jgi:ribosomal protein S18 acetylase RimI-like enzyme
MFRAEKMRVEDFSFAVQLANTMDWNMAGSDFEFARKLEPDGCFVLWQGQERVGIATCISYGRTGWFGNLIVREEHRGKGAGAFLVKHAVTYLKKRDIETVGLYAYPHLVGFYREIGFKPLDDFVVFSGEPLPCALQSGLIQAEEKDIPSLVELDQRCFGWDRKRLLESIVVNKDNLCYISVEDNEVVGFVAAKIYGKMAEIGPLICREENRGMAAELFQAILCRLWNLDVYVCVPEKETALLATLLNAGLKKKFRLTRMFLGSAAAQSCVYVPESLERG